MRKIDEWNEIPMSMRPKVRWWLPAACVDDDDIVRELEDLCVRGFGGVEVCCRMILPNILQSEEGWGRPHWEHVIDLIDRTAARLGMTMDLTNGSNWPIAMRSIESADDEAAGYELTWGELTLPGDGKYSGPLPERAVTHDEGTPHRIAVLAYQMLPGEEKVLDRASLRDLSGLVEKDENIDVDLGAPAVGNTWVLFAFYEQPTAEKINGGEYVIDHKGKAGAAACAACWEPQFEAHRGYAGMESIFCDSMEYSNSIEWCRGFIQEFEFRRGYSLLPYLPVIGAGQGAEQPAVIPGYRFSDQAVSDAVNMDYMETLTDCYCENHLAPLEAMAEAHGKTIRYQVAYNKPFEIERSALCVGVPENEALGRCALDSQKAMASAAHLGRKERYSFECAAEYANAYGQSYEDLLWWVKRSLMAGMNAQVLHGASYSGAYHGVFSGVMGMPGNVPMSAWPGFEAFRKCVSNYWNRTPDAEHARGCLDAVARMNAVFRKTAKVDVAVYRQEYLNSGHGTDGYELHDGNALGDQGYSYEYVSSALLDLPVCHVQNGELDAEGVGYRCLLIPERTAVSARFLHQVHRLLDEELPVFWQGAKPAAPQYYSEVKTEEGAEAWRQLLDEVWTDPRLRKFADIKDAPEALTRAGVLPRVRVHVLSEAVGSDVVLQKDAALMPASREGSSERDAAGTWTPEASVSRKELLNLVTAVREDAQTGRTYYALHRFRPAVNDGTANPESFGVTGIFQKGTAMPFYQKPGAASAVRLSVRPERGTAFYLCDPWSGTQRPVNPAELSLEEDQMLILMAEDEPEEKGLFPQEENPMRDPAAEGEPGSGDAKEVPADRGFGKTVTLTPVLSTLTLYAFGPDTPEEGSFLRSGFSEEGETFDLTRTGLVPWCQLGERYRYYAGKGVYEGTLSAPSVEKDTRYEVRLAHVCDTFRVWLNGRELPYPDQDRKIADLTGAVKEGTNDIRIEVVSNLYNAVVGPQHEQPDFVFGAVMPYADCSYGIWE